MDSGLRVDVPVDRNGQKQGVYTALHQTVLAQSRGQHRALCVAHGCTATIRGYLVDEKGPRLLPMAMATVKCMWVCDNDGA
jgi:hypothetical protein